LIGTAQLVTGHVYHAITISVNVVKDITYQVNNAMNVVPTATLVPIPLLVIPALSATQNKDHTAALPIASLVTSALV
jgi:hypothetical protein